MSSDDKIRKMLYKSAVDVLAFHAQECSCQLSETGEEIVNGSIEEVLDAHGLSKFYTGRHQKGKDNGKKNKG